MQHKYPSGKLEKKAIRQAASMSSNDLGNAGYQSIPLKNMF